MIEIKNKKISVIGAVRSGVSAAKLIKKLGGIPFVSDLGDEEKLKESINDLKSEGINYETGKHTERVYD